MQQEGWMVLRRISTSYNFYKSNKEFDDKLDQTNEEAGW